MKEGRLHPRVPLRLEVSWNGTQTRPGITADISRGGCYIESIVGVGVGEVFRFNFRLGNGLSVELVGKVLYVHPTIGFGVRFGHLNVAQLQTLLRVLGSARAELSPAGRFGRPIDRGPA